MNSRRHSESHVRSLVKALLWRAMGTCATATIIWALTGRLDFAAKIGLVDTVFKIAAYYVYERLWNRIPHGRARNPEYEI